MKKLKIILAAALFTFIISCQKDDVQVKNLSSEDILNAKGGPKAEAPINSTSKSFTSEWRMDWPVQTGSTYKIKISGLYSDGGGINNLDAAYDLRGNIPYNTCDILNQSRWRFINQCIIRPDIDVVNDLHQYEYTFIADGDLLSIDFKDCCYDDNSGQLTFELFLISGGKTDPGGKPTPITNGLIAYYPFSGNANDVSGNANNGIASGTTLTADRFGKRNSAFSFDGANSRITIPFSQENITSYSVCAWFKTSKGGTIFGGRGINGETGLTLVLYNSALGGIYDGQFLWEADASGGGIGKLSSSTFIDNNWHFVVGTFEGQAGSILPSQFNVYVDGILVDQIDSYTTNASAPINMFNSIVGNHNMWTNGGGFLGILDEIRLYNRAITATEITSLYKFR